MPINQQMPLPSPRGPISAHVLRTLVMSPKTDAGSQPLSEPGPDAVDALSDDDLQLSLYVLYELHHQGLQGIDDRWEWSPALLQLRARLEDRFELALRDRLPSPPAVQTAEELGEWLQVTTRPDPGGRLTSFVARRAELVHVRELLTHRSVYHLKEADPHTWAIPRLHGGPKTALAEIQSDEYGGGRPERAHATLFARAMSGVGLDSAYGALLDQVPAVSLAVVNAMTLFGLHRRRRGACVGHLTAFEMTSTHPNRRYAQGMRRLGLGEDVTAYFDEHVEADAVHEQIACHDLAGALARQDPRLIPDVVAGAQTALLLDDLVADHLLAAWARGRSSLRSPVVVSGPQQPADAEPAVVATSHATSESQDADLYAAS